MTTQLTWLAEVPESHRNLVWVDENAEEMFDYITTAIKTRHDAEIALDTLLLIFPQLTHRADFKRWVKVARDANRLLNVWRRENGDPTDPIGQIYIFKPQGKRNIPPKGKRRPRVRTDASDVYELYLNLLLHKAYSQTNWLTQERVNDVLRFARRVNDAYLYHKTYQMLAFVYNAHYLFERALDYAHLALPYFEEQDLEDTHNITEVALTYFAMSDSHLGLRNTGLAIGYNEKASELFSQSDYPRQYAVIMAQRGKLHIASGEFEAAFQWLQQAASEAEQLGMIHHVADLYAHIGMAQSLNNDYDDAFQNLDRAMELWTELNRKNQQLFVQYVIAHAETKMGKTDEAIARLNQIKEAVSPKQDEGWQKLRYEQAENLIKLINEGVDLEEMQKKTYRRS